MTNEKKEGVLIAAVSIALLAIFLLRTTWYDNTLPASVWLFDGFDVACNVGEVGCSASGTKRLLQIGFDLSWGIAFLVPLFAYGLLRAFGIVRRLFAAEKKLLGFLIRSNREDFPSTKPDQL
jgi:hypothetical protein